MHAIFNHLRWPLFLGVFLLAEMARSWADTTQWDGVWQRKVEVSVVESAGLARMNEPVQVSLSKTETQLGRLNREVRVIVVPEGKEVPSQVLKHEGGAVVVFQVSMEAKKQRRFRIYFDNPKAKAPIYKTDLLTRPVTGFVKIEPLRAFALSIRNGHVRVDLHPKSGQIGKMAFLKGTGDLWGFVGGNQNA